MNIHQSKSPLGITKSWPSGPGYLLIKGGSRFSSKCLHTLLYTLLFHLYRFVLERNLHFEMACRKFWLFPVRAQSASRILSKRHPGQPKDF